MEVNSFQILLIKVTFYLYHYLNVILNVVIKINKKRIYSGPAVKGLKYTFAHLDNYIKLLNDSTNRTK